MGAREVNLDSLTVKLYKFKADELKLNLSFSAVQQLFQIDLLHEVVESWRNGFNLLDKIMFNNETDSDVEQARLVVKNSLKLELQIGRESCRESVCQYETIWGVDVSLHKT